MIGSLYTAASAIIAQQRRMDSVANDVANVNTAAYKPQRTAFEEMPGGQVQATDLGADFAQGGLEETGQPLDLAIQGDGFFQVRQANGSIALTRNGTFHVDAGGQIVTAAGDQLQPPIALPPGVDGEGVRVAADGTVMAGGVALGAITLVNVPAPSGLIAAGGGLYSPTAASGAPQPANGAVVVQGALEGSGTDLADSVVGMIEARASTAAASATFRAQDQMLAALLGIAD